MPVKTTQNIHILAEIAQALGEIKDEVVFIGGATTALYIDDPAAPTPTPSDDVDLVVEITGRQDYQKLEQRLRNKGFIDPVNEDSPPICRKIFKGTNVDIMPTDPSILGFSNPWYPEAIANKNRVKLPGGEEIFIFTLPYFLATKLVAYNNRGKKDPRWSQDLEDICNVLDGNLGIEDRVNTGPENVRDFIREHFQNLLKDSELFEEAAHGFIGNSGDPASRANRIVKIARAIAYP